MEHTSPNQFVGQGRLHGSVEGLARMDRASELLDREENEEAPPSNRSLPNSMMANEHQRLNSRNESAEETIIRLHKELDSTRNKLSLCQNRLKFFESRARNMRQTADHIQRLHDKCADLSLTVKRCEIELEQKTKRIATLESELRSLDPKNPSLQVTKRTTCAMGNDPITSHDDFLQYQLPADLLDYTSDSSLSYSGNPVLQATEMDITGTNDGAERRVSQNSQGTQSDDDATDRLCERKLSSSSFEVVDDLTIRANQSLNGSNSQRISDLVHELRIARAGRVDSERQLNESQARMNELGEQIHSTSQHVTSLERALTDERLLRQKAESDVQRRDKVIQEMLKKKSEMTKELAEKIEEIALLTAKGSCDVKDAGLNTELDLLQQQVTLFEEDFMHERRDRERLHRTKKTLERHSRIYEHERDAAIYRARASEAEVMALRQENENLHRRLEQMMDQLTILTNARGATKRVHGFDGDYRPEYGLTSGIVSGVEPHESSASRQVDGAEALMSMDSPLTSVAGHNRMLQSDWECTYCTLINSCNRTMCDACGHEHRLT